MTIAGNILYEDRQAHGGLGLARQSMEVRGRMIMHDYMRRQVEYHRRQAEYHATLVGSIVAAAAHPWLPVAPDPPKPK